MKRKCKDCGREFDTRYTNRNQQTCDECIEKRAKPCAICGRMFNKRSSESYGNFDKRMTCSRACAIRYKTMRRHGVEG